MIHKYILLTILLIVSNNTTAKDIEYVKTKDIIMSFVSEFNPDVSDDAISVPDYHRDSASFRNRCGIGAVRIPALAKSVTIHSRLNR